MRVDFDVAMEVAAHEALVRQAYRDSARVLTWCIGMTNATGHRVERYIGKPQSLQHCMDIYVWALTNYAEQVREVFKDHPLTQAQFAAAVSFHWNTGAIRRASWVRHFKAGDMAKARKTFMDWRKPPEIMERRRKERDLFFDGIWSNNGTMLEYTRVHGNLSPDWSSGRVINVEQELRAAFLKTEPPTLDQLPQPDAKPKAPTLSPEKPAGKPISAREPDAPGKPTSPSAGKGGGILAAIIAILAAAGALIANLPCDLLEIWCG
ncbi:lysozyme [Nitratireductor sp. GCM10026969]|uniref:lysozyme n=1 Tax=Nitratireductor sp. GCM10026969 TaxID=3252645 RepID=UPI0036132303